MDEQKSILPRSQVRILAPGKKGVIAGVGGPGSLALDTAIYLAEMCDILVYPICHSEKRADRLNKLEKNPNIREALFCDVLNEREMDACFAKLASEGPFDFFLHCIAGTTMPKALAKEYHEVTREEQENINAVTGHSFKDMVVRMKPLMPNGGCLAGMSYMGADKIVEGYEAVGMAKRMLEGRALTLQQWLGQEHWVLIFRLPPKRSTASTAIRRREQIGLFNRAMSPRGLRASRAQIVQGIAFGLLADSGLCGIVNFDNGVHFMERNLARHADIMQRVAEQDQAISQGLHPKNPIDDIMRDE